MLITAGRAIKTRNRPLWVIRGSEEWDPSLEKLGLSDEECEASVVAGNVPEVPPVPPKAAAPAATPVISPLGKQTTQLELCLDVVGWDGDMDLWKRFTRPGMLWLEQYGCSKTSTLTLSSTLMLHWILISLMGMMALFKKMMNEPPGARIRVGLTALTMSEYVWDVNEQDVLLFIDNIFRFVQAGSEVSALLGRMPSAVGYQPTLSTEMGSLQERITSTKEGSITSIQAVYVPADDLTDPAPATTFAHLDATTVLSRGLAAKGIYPAVDPLDSMLTMLQPPLNG
ncbi:hypothetical protein NE237_008025 [Protea cynaroides]|uniref:H(+)-transporting two-sector ATPase n=1 Tax=Protea cynaroides TaxID=273540 RepID=A0A9Q0KR53_9MAGN|nr:hypothetical protein NE237_008025 [Protea cynaroides]